MIKSSPFFRSRRRRASLALFGSPLPRTAVEPMADRLWNADNGAKEVLRGALPHEDAGHRAELHDVITRLQREARADQHLRHADEDACNRLIDETVRALWDSSRVKAFVPLFAMQRVREHLGLADEVQAAENGGS